MNYLSTTFVIMTDLSRRVLYAHISRCHSYQEVWQLQTHLQQKLVRAKRSGDFDHPGYLLLCEHNPVYTLGKSGSAEHLLLEEDQLSKDTFEFFKINRGGDITYHGPGQITGYPILDLDQYYHDLHRYIRELEEVVIRTLGQWDIEGSRVDGYTGVWIEVRNSGLPRPMSRIKRKVCAIGVHMSRWVTMHGFALNVNTDLSHFNHIVPCGIQDEDKVVTSMAQELGHDVEQAEVRNALLDNMEEIFGMTFV